MITVGIIKVLFCMFFIYQIKHFLADYLLQGKYMLGKFKDVGWELPLAAHCGVHAGITLGFGLVVGLGWLAVLLAVFDFVSHFAIDRMKVVYGKNTDPSKQEFWWLLGLDQMMHHFVHYIIIFIMVVEMFAL